MPMAGGNDGLVRCTLVDELTCEDCVGVLSALNVALAGLREVNLYRALCRDAIRAYPMVCFLARSGDQPAGIVLAIVDYGSYWRRFPLRHPFLALRILLRKAAALIAPGQETVTAHDREAELPDPEKGSASASWSESNCHIAKILFIGVLPDFQRRGIGHKLYASLFSFLAQIGVCRVDARIAANNVSSIRLHRKSGWRVLRDERGIFATIVLPPPSISC
jgi:ribosomal protein S18 acetylase RimI-like enzyme